jgi:PAS domain S-box-containing protein
MKQDSGIRKRAEEEAQSKAAFLEAVLDNDVLGILVVDQEGKKSLQNQCFIDMFGIPPQIADDKAGERRLPWVADRTQNPSQFLDKVRHLYAHPAERSDEEFELKDGTTLEQHSSPVVGKDGKYYGRVWTFRDITARKRAEEELRRKTAFLEAQVNCSTDGILAVDQNRTITLQNQRFIDLFKMPPRLAGEGTEENRLRWAADAVKDPQAFLERVLHLYAHPDETSHDEIELKDGTILDRYTFPAIGKDGKYYGRIWTYRDMTGRKRAEEALRKIKIELAHAMSLAQLAAWEYDVASGMFTFSDSYYALHGTTAKLENGYLMSAADYARKYMHPDDAHLVADETAKAVATSDPNYHSQLENRILRRDGEVRHVLTFMSITKDAAGRTIQLHGANQDITGRKRMEARLFQSQKMETVGKLAGGIAHEFNSIMTAILGQCEMMLGDLPEGNPLRQKTTQIYQAADRAATLTRQLLAYGRKQLLQPEVLDLNTVLAGMENTIRHLAGHDVDVLIAPPTGPMLVKADPGQIEQVIVNIVMNAADAMPRGGKLTLETGGVVLDRDYTSQFPDLKPGEYVVLAITDTGAGMSEAVKARLFEPFFTTKEVGQGTGLGLATCHGILKQSGGHINVYSEPGRGATFKIYLPRVQPEKKPASPPISTPDLPRGTETILLVEDDPALREMAAELLGRLGYTVLTAGNGLEALNVTHQAATGYIDLLFTDVVMPQMSGKELADRVRALYPHTKILFTSAYTGNAIVHQGVLDKNRVLLQKPFTPSALARKVREILDSTPETTPS